MADVFNVPVTEVPIQMDGIGNFIRTRRQSLTPLEVTSHLLAFSTGILVLLSQLRVFRLYSFKFCNARQTKFGISVSAPLFKVVEEVIEAKAESGAGATMEVS